MRLLLLAMMMVVVARAADPGFMLTRNRGELLLLRTSYTNHSLGTDADVYIPSPQTNQLILSLSPASGITNDLLVTVRVWGTATRTLNRGVSAQTNVMRLPRNQTNTIRLNCTNTIWTVTPQRLALVYTNIADVPIRP